MSALLHTVKWQLAQGLRAWLIASNGLTDAQVILANPKDPNARPPLPYLTVLVRGDAPIGVDARVPAGATVVQITAAIPATTYGVSIDAAPISYLAVAGDTVASIARALAALNPDALAVGDTITFAVGAVTAPVGALTITIEQPAVFALGGRRGTASIQGYGDGTSDWLEAAVLGLQRPSVRDIIDAAGITIVPIGDVLDLSTLLDTSIEPRFSLDVALGFTLRGPTEAQISTKTVVVTESFAPYKGAVPTLDTITIDLP